MSHTPGPWEQEPVEGSTSYAYRIATTERMIAHLWHHPGQRPKVAAIEQETADANLIAAAPDLLAALIRLREWVRHPGVDDSPENESVIHQAEAAIARANGRPR